MKKILLCLATLLLLTACAASSFRTVRENANQVTNGMTVKEASARLGMEPTNVTSEKIQWRRGNAQIYDATPLGAVEYKVSNGRTVGIPSGGIFGAEARRLYLKEFQARYALSQADQDAAAAAAEAAKAEREKRESFRSEESRMHRIAALQAEMKAAEKATVTCNDKVMCTKIFALAQIFIAQNADQKIQVATDTIIQTYNPTEPGALGASITKTPQRGTIEVVTVVPSCKDGTGMDNECISRRTVFYDKFRLFIAENLKK